MEYQSTGAKTPLTTQAQSFWGLHLTTWRYWTRFISHIMSVHACRLNQTVECCKVNMLMCSYAVCSG